MLTDGKIDSFDTHLEQFKLDNQTAQNAIQVNDAQVDHTPKIVNHK
jgi:hypothetical protein